MANSGSVPHPQTYTFSNSTEIVCLLVSAPAESHRTRAIIRSSAERCRDQQTNYHSRYLIQRHFQWADVRAVTTEGDLLQQQLGVSPQIN